jgi:hypothetical protein
LISPRYTDTIQYSTVLYRPSVMIVSRILYRLTHPVTVKLRPLRFLTEAPPHQVVQ